MIRIFKTIDGRIRQEDLITDGCWVDLTNPTATEILEIADTYKIDIEHLKASLDEEERSRVEVEKDYTLILVDIPTIEERNGKDWYVTIPLGIIISETNIFTICLEDTPILKAFADGRIRDFHTSKKTRFILQVLYKNASMFLNYLRVIDKHSEIIERKLHASTKNKEVIELLELSKSLVYFNTSLRSNEVVFEKLLKNDKIKQYPEDEELLEDVIIENKQAIEMAGIYSGILSGTMDAFASVISNNLNIVMKYLAVVTIVLSIPNMISGFYGMNVNSDGVPFASSPYGFWIVILIAIIISSAVAFILAKKDLF
ncbi:MAG: magnesium transporter CorA family protein [Clostridiales bacterium]|nr:magnesium transporter CorA family protein [Clostridiales bacterium]